MPRACPVAASRSQLQIASEHLDATGLPRGASRSLLQKSSWSLQDATGLSRGASRSLLQKSSWRLQDATGLPRGASRLLLQRALGVFRMPRACLVEPHACCYKLVAISNHQSDGAV